MVILLKLTFLAMFGALGWATLLRLRPDGAWRHWMAWAISALGGVAGGLLFSALTRHIGDPFVGQAFGSMIGGYLGGIGAGLVAATLVQLRSTRS